MLLSKHYLRIILLYTALYQILSRYTEDKKQASKTQTYIQTEAQKKKNPTPKHTKHYGSVKGSPFNWNSPRLEQHVDTLKKKPKKPTTTKTKKTFLHSKNYDDEYSEKYKRLICSIKCRII